MAMRILLVEDQIKVADFILKGVKTQGYAVDHTERGKEAEELVAANDYDLIILDVNLPDQSGLITSSNLRKAHFKKPILMLTALSETKNKVEGFDAGADDYLVKPFEFEELFARMRALLRRNTQAEASLLKYHDLEMDLVNRKVKRNGSEIVLTNKEFSLLEYFLRNAERPLTRNQISEHVWDIHFDSNTNVIDVYVNLIRKKIDRKDEVRLIHTMVGYGYILKR